MALAKKQESFQSGRRGGNFATRSKRNYSAEAKNIHSAGRMTRWEINQKNPGHIRRSFSLEKNQGLWEVKRKKIQSTNVFQVRPVGLTIVVLKKAWRQNLLNEQKSQSKKQCGFFSFFANTIIVALLLHSEISVSATCQEKKRKEKNTTMPAVYFCTCSLIPQKNS